ncbi:hypothetical protein SAMN04488033_12215 [Salegentibacter agarivorans]|uniref:Uncharacterized protein n=1 Tax=Salegentibacter agarivorans TaxID=345907 RepID=A0A1I2NKE6_9FLAO|nr:hypothetical protein SAMN04488033_12215 [Salegentibacter agarivorans]
MDKLKSEQVSTLSTKIFNEDEWKPVIEFFWNRYNKRYFDQIKILENHDNENKKQLGFLTASIMGPRGYHFLLSIDRSLNAIKLNNSRILLRTRFP